MTDKMLLERLARQSIYRIMDISLSCLFGYISKLYEVQADDLNYCVQEGAKFTMELIDKEAGEMWSFVKEKANKK